jgi:MFS family permease
MGTSASPAVAVVLLAGVGIAGGLALSLIVAGIQANAPESVRGRVLSMYTIISQVVPAASGVIAGALVQGFGVGVALVVCGGTLALAMLGNAGWMGALRGHRG